MTTTLYNVQLNDIILLICKGFILSNCDKHSIVFVIISINFCLTHQRTDPICREFTVKLGHTPTHYIPLTQDRLQIYVLCHSVSFKVWMQHIY